MMQPSNRDLQTTAVSRPHLRPLLRGYRVSLLALPRTPPIEEGEYGLGGKDWSDSLP